MGEIMKRKLTKLIAMLLVTATLFSINVSMTITASAVESAIGDINQDGAVTIEDARLLLSDVAKITPLTEEQLALADYDNSTAVDIADVRAILKAVTVGEDFEDNLYKAGFPASYVEMLVELHNKYPEWEFKPFMTGLTWEEAVNGEHTPHKKQLIEKSVDSYLKCDCEKCDGVIQEASSWVSASKAAVEYYLDPRNFLTEKYIFQFESTAYSDTHTVDGVEAILDGTWMEDSFITYFDAEGTGYLSGGISVKQINTTSGDNIIGDNIIIKDNTILAYPANNNTKPILTVTGDQLLNTSVESDYSFTGESCGSIAYSGVGETCGSVASSSCFSSSSAGGCSYSC
jgi:hypothetical protein